MAQKIPPENRGSYAGVRTIANRHKGTISFYSYNANKVVRFKAFITGYRDSFRVNVGNEHFVGHSEPLRKVKNIERVLNISFDCPAYDTSEARKHLEDLKLLVQMLYPAVVRENAAGVVQQYVRSGGDPVFSLKFLNFIGDPQSNNAGTLAAYEDRTSVGSKTNQGVISSGLKGYVDGLTYDFDWSQRGGFLHKPGESQYLYPKMIKISFAFLPFHEITPGWLGRSGEREFANGEGMPYKIGSPMKGVAGPTIKPFDSAADANARVGAVGGVEQQVAGNIEKGILS